jgi:hypothetical protein
LTEHREAIAKAISRLVNPAIILKGAMEGASQVRTSHADAVNRESINNLIYKQSTNGKSEVELPNDRANHLALIRESQH